MTATNSDSVPDPYNFVKTAILPPSENLTLEARQDSEKCGLGVSPSEAPFQDSDLVRQQWAKGTSPARGKPPLGKEFTRGIAFIKIDFQHQNLHCVDKHPISPRSIHHLDAFRSLS